MAATNRTGRCLWHSVCSSRLDGRRLENGRNDCCSLGSCSPPLTPMLCPTPVLVGRDVVWSRTLNDVVSAKSPSFRRLTSPIVTSTELAEASLIDCFVAGKIDRSSRTGNCQFVGHGDHCAGGKDPRDRMLCRRKTIIDFSGLCRKC